MISINFNFKLYISVLFICGLISISTFMARINSFSYKKETFTLLQYDILNSTISDQLTLNNKSLKNVVLTIFSTTKKDPQRNKQMPSTINYMANFYMSVKLLNINTIIFYDNLSSEFVSNYTTNNIKFQWISMDPKLSINDYRFLVYNDWLKCNKYKFILMVDLADVFFWKDPFEYMEEKTAHSLFISPDLGTLATNGWMKHNFRKCYTSNFTDLNHPSYNVGVWGGTMESVQCMLNCEVTQLRITSERAFNCDIIAFNWCINNSRCIIKHQLDDNSTFINPFRRNCEKKYSIIHDKCASSAGRCMFVVNNTLIRKPCNTRHGYYIR